MEPKYLEEERYLKALNRVKQIQGFYWHLFLYLAIMIILLVFVYGGFEDRGGVFKILKYIHFDSTYWNVYWFWSSFIIWGAIVLIQGIYVFAFKSNWEERKIRELMDKEDSSSF